MGTTDVNTSGNDVAGRLERRGTHKVIKPEFDGDGNRIDIKPEQDSDQQNKNQEEQSKPVEKQEDADVSYWREEATKARDIAEKLSGAAKYTGIISYLEENPGAVSMLQEHMQGITDPAGTPSGETERALYGQPTGQEPAVPPQGNTGQAIDPNMQAEITARKELFKKFSERLAEEGMPSTELDQFTQWTMNPGQFTPEQVFKMWKAVNGNVPEVPQDEPNNTENEQTSESNDDTEMPPASVAGISGERQDPRTEISEMENRRARMLANPNDLSTLV